MQDIDATIDDGDLTTGSFRKVSSTRYFFSVANYAASRSAESSALGPADASVPVFAGTGGAGRGGEAGDGAGWGDGAGLGCIACGSAAWAGGAGLGGAAGDGAGWGCGAGLGWAACG